MLAHQTISTIRIEDYSVATSDQTDQMKRKKLRFGIVGCGAIGPTHAGALAQIEGAELVAVADLIPQRASELAAKHGVTEIYSNGDDLIASDNVDVVSLCTPSGMHADAAIKALRAGKHVVVEKPMAISLADCDRMIAAERETGKKLTVISQHRFDPASITVKRLIDSGQLGKIILAEGSVKWWRTQEYYDSGDWRGTWRWDGGGALINQAVHTVDVLQWLVGDIKRVYALTRTSAHERIEVEDIAVFTIEFASGAIGTFTGTTAAYEGFPARMDLFGTDGSAIIEADSIKQITLKNGQSQLHQQAATHAINVARGGTASVKDEATQPRASADPGAIWGDAHRTQLLNFIHSIHCGGQPLIDGAQGRKPVAVVLGVYESARIGKPVDIF